MALRPYWSSGVRILGQPSLCPRLLVGIQSKSAPQFSTVVSSVSLLKRTMLYRAGARPWNSCWTCDWDYRYRVDNVVHASTAAGSRFEFTVFEDREAYPAEI